MSSRTTNLQWVPVYQQSRSYVELLETKTTSCHMWSSLLITKTGRKGHASHRNSCQSNKPTNRPHEPFYVSRDGTVTVTGSQLSLDYSLLLSPQHPLQPSVPSQYSTEILLSYYLFIFPRRGCVGFSLNNVNFVRRNKNHIIHFSNLHLHTLWMVTQV